MTRNNQATQARRDTYDARALRDASDVHTAHDVRDTHGLPDTQDSQVKKAPLVAALMAVMFLAAMEITITALAAPTILQDLAGFDLMSLMFSSYLVASAITTPLFGFLADRYGRKRTLILGISIFLMGCALCGFAQSMPMLIAFRVVQGLGAGSIFTLSFTIVGDAFPLQSRAAVLGALSAMWGVAGIAGPVLGGFLIELFSWHWVFLVNIPIGLACIALVSFSFKERFVAQKRARRSDNFKGIFTRLSVVVNSVSLFSCMIMVGFDVYLVFYLQSVLGYSPMIAGLSLLPMSISWLIVSYVCGWLLLKFEGRRVVLASGLAVLACTALFISMDTHTTLLMAIVYIFLSGFGLGAVLTATTMIIQESVGYDKRGTAVGVNGFLKTVGQAIGVSIFGVAFNAQLAGFFASHSITGINVSSLTQSEGVAQTLDNTLLVQALDSGIDVLFWAMFAMATLAILATLIMPRIQLSATQTNER